MYPANTQKMNYCFSQSQISPTQFVVHAESGLNRLEGYDLAYHGSSPTVGTHVPAIKTTR